MSGGLVHIVDDDELVRIATGSLLEDAGYDVHLYASGDDFLTKADLSIPACVLLDLRMPGISGEEMLRRLAGRPVPLSVLIVSGHVDIRLAVAMMREGAVNVIEKPWRPADFLQAIEQAFTTLGKQAEAANAATLFGKLTRRERDVVEAVASHGTSPRVAEALGLSVRTVEWYRASAMKRLQVSSSAEMLNLYFSAANRSGSSAHRRRSA